MQCRSIYASCAILIACASSSSSPQILSTGISPDDIPEAVLNAIAAKHPTFRVREATKKRNQDRVYFDVEGVLPDGSQLEFDVLETPSGAEVVEIQRDLTWEALPTNVQQLSQRHSERIRPSRIIESIQADGSIVYEFFAKDAPRDPAYEIQVRGDRIEVLKQRSIH